ncbi:hypothetical protein PUR71_10065 [Streptomyces sp. SP17BM10]|uniref:hypothetical protein n=1 Tax=Streptomyces sp. SP17BM10 TaxID=3002530 RepID=UPI002E778BAC|nr:hypothetical protein [Streptomyces sp. SP17BM10]MEE1783255.1 hypothetical protein [Streptomyces sp. SP17BM10]
MFLVLIGLVFLVISVEGITRGPILARIFYFVILLGSAWFTYRGARLGLTIDKQGITERSLGRTRRFGWSELGEPTVVQQTGNAANPLYVVTIPHRAAGEVRLPATARFNRNDTERIRDRVAELQVLAEHPAS